MIHLQKIFKISISILVLGILYYTVGLSQITQQLQKMNVYYLPLILVFLLLTLLLNALNVYVTVRPLKKISLKKSIQYYFYSWSLGFFGLGKVGELSIIYWLKKEGLTTGQATAIAMLDKIITFATLVILSAIGLVLFFDLTQVIQLIALIVLALAITVFLVFTPKGRSIIKKIMQGYSEKFTGFGAASQLYFKNHKSTLLLNAGITVTRWLTQAFFAVYLFASFGFNADWPIVLLMTSVSTLISLIPISFNGLGIKEATFTALAAKMQWPIETTISVLTVSLALHYGILAIVLILFANELRNYRQNTERG